jgi:N-acetylglucosamine-6-phosphate deacetylase
MLGRLAPGYRADIVAFEPDTLNVLATWVAGSREGEPLDAGVAQFPAG